MIPSGPVVPGTRLRTSRIEPSGEGFVWTRRPGPDAPHAFVVLPRAVADRIASITTALGSRWVPGRGHGGERAYRLRAGRSVAGLLVRGERTGDSATSLRELGLLLRALHSLAVPAPEEGVEPSPPTIARIEAWFAPSRPTTGTTDRLASARSCLLTLLGERRWKTLHEWTRWVAETEGRVVSHGWAGLGRCAAQHGGSVEALIGEEVALAPAAFDVGLLVGELLEMRRFLPAPDTPWSGLLDGLVRGYGRPLDAPVLRCAALGVLLHLHDYCAYTDGALEGEVRPRADLVTTLMERGG